MGREMAGQAGAAMVRRELGRVGSFSSRFSSDERGVTAVIFGIIFSVLLLSMGLAIDYTLAVTEKLDEQAALDAATLAAAKQLGQADQDTKGKAVAEAFFKENLDKTSSATIKSIYFDAENSKVDAQAGMSMTTKILKLFGHKEIDIGVAASVAQGDGTVEVAMVLDNSGSMSGSYIADLKVAAQDLADIVLDGNGGSADKVRIGLVPFAASVNVGAANAAASWIDRSGHGIKRHCCFIGGTWCAVARGYWRYHSLFTDT